MGTGKRRKEENLGPESMSTDDKGGKIINRGEKGNSVEERGKDMAF